MQVRPEFNTIQDTEQKKSYLLTAQNCPCQIWISQEKRHLAKVKNFDPKEKKLDIQMDKDTIKIFLAQMYQQTNRNVFCCISHLKAQLFFNTVFLSRQGSDLQFEEPQTLYKVQRRTNERYYCLENKNPFLLTLPGATKKKVYNLSSQGLSFIFSQKDPETSLFQEHTYFNEAKLELKKTITIINFKILYIRPFSCPTDPTQDRKAAALFKIPSPLDQQILDATVSNGKESDFFHLFRFS
jgi:hypothetical protein